MKSVPLKPSGAAYINVGIAELDGAEMPMFKFLVDTGSTRTTINKSDLTNLLGYTEDYIQNNKILIPDKDKPRMADGTPADLYKIPITRINISGHEIQSDYVLTSDTIKDLNLLLGLEILRYFKFTYDFDAIDADTPNGCMFYEFRSSQIAPYTKLGGHFAYNLNDSAVDEET